MWTADQSNKLILWEAEQRKIKNKQAGDQHFHNSGNSKIYKTEEAFDSDDDTYDSYITIHHIKKDQKMKFCGLDYLFKSTCPLQMYHLTPSTRMDRVSITAEDVSCFID